MQHLLQQGMTVERNKVYYEMHVIIILSFMSSGNHVIGWRGGDSI